MKLKDILHLFVFDEYCEVYIVENEDEQPNWCGMCSEIPFWLVNMPIDESGGISVGYSKEDEKECFIFCVSEDM